MFLLPLFITINCNSQIDNNNNLKDGNQYSIRYKKLKELHIKQIHSKSYLKADSLLGVFIRKMDVKFAPSEVREIVPIEWTRENISKTRFKNLQEAEDEWGNVLAAQASEEIENAEFHDYSIETLLTTKSAEMLIAIQQEVMSEYPDKSGIHCKNSSIYKE